jgi:hypothetical protein
VRKRARLGSAGKKVACVGAMYERNQFATV